MFRAGVEDALRFRRRGRGGVERGAPGFTFLEVMVALAILSGVVVAVATALNFHLNTVGRLRKTGYAAMLARVKMEEINISGPPPAAQGDFTTYGHPEYGWAYVSEDFMIKGVKKVHVTVTWDGGQGYTIETYRR